MVYLSCSREDRMERNKVMDAVDLEYTLINFRILEL